MGRSCIDVGRKPRMPLPRPMTCVPGRPGLADAGRTSSASEAEPGNAHLEAIITVSLLGSEGHAKEVDAVVDTGFNGFLTLPPMLVADLGLPIVGDGEALADGSEAAFDVHSVTVLWDGQLRAVETGAVGGDPLVGMALMEDHDLSIQVTVGESPSRVAEPHRRSPSFDASHMRPIVRFRLPAFAPHLTNPQTIP